MREGPSGGGTSRLAGCSAPAAEEWSSWRAWQPKVCSSQPGGFEEEGVGQFQSGALTFALGLGAGQAMDGSCT